ncbi:helix-turn-helix domain-containing protein [Gulosibacter chungangensis]|uniref:Helix-turn-helix transcriptional regulator n=1 Tax=Gulosibacter chungangensis TaxID=979746 RepID=A0A7J5B9K6_9MICO|nr:helix-turn-helix transcriptional regulator [Gulosibacter chungangensis]KAB1642260.1 helix-turn-helix transcriptional regulator [Gulosibacter chungangensis]
MTDSPRLRRPTPIAIKRGLADFGEHFSEWRRLQNLSIANVAERSNVSESTIARLERGEGASLENILRIARTLGILEHLITASDPWSHDRGKLLASSQLPKRGGRK